MKKLFPVLIITFFSAGLCLHLQAQDTLPRFSLKNVGNNRIIVSWANTFQNIRQLSIQRSFDSLQNYKTILTVPDPATPQNGYLDTKATNDHMFYRLYILLDKGIYIFSDAKKPVLDTISRMAKINVNGKIETLPGTDTLGNLNVNIKNKVKPDVFVPSIYVFTYKSGYVRVSLPDDEKKYSIKFFEDDGTFLFELKEIKEKKFSIDKSDFYHSGWFRFELYGDGKLIEKHKFYLEKEF